MRKALLALIILSTATIAAAQTTAFNGYCTQGATSSQTSGLASSNKLQGLIPQCQVEVFLTGTTNLATIYSDGSDTPLTNPFTADQKGKWLFYAALNQGYDVVMSGGIPPLTYTSPVTLTDLFVGLGSGSALVVEVNGTPISPASPANFVDSSTVTFAFTGGQIQATAASSSGCSVTGIGQTDVLSVYPTGTCFGDSSFTWDHINYNLLVGNPITLLSGAANEYLVGPDNTETQGDTLNFVTGDTNSISGTPGNSSNVTDAFVYGGLNSISVTPATDSGIAFVGINGESNKITSTVNGIGNTWITGFANTVEDTVNPTREIEITGGYNDVDGSISTLQMNGYLLRANNVSYDNTLTVNGYLAGSQNSIVHTGGLTLQDFSDAFGHLDYVHDCADCTAMGMGVEESTNHEFGIGASRIPELKITSGNVERTPLTLGLPAPIGNSYVVSGTLPSTAGTCNVAFTGGTGSGGTGTITIVAGWPIVGLPIPITAAGSYSVAPTGGTLSNGTLTCSGSIVVQSSLEVIPACSAGLQGSYASFTDSTTNVYGATIAGGGTDKVMGYCDGTNWTVMGGGTGGGGMVYPGAGIPVSTGSAWASSLAETDGDILYGAGGSWTKGTALPNGITATTQTVGDNTTKVATDAFVLANASGSMTWPSSPGYALYSGSSSWSTTHITDSGTAITASEPFTVTPASGDAGILGLASNTTNPALWTGEFNLLGSPSATVTAFAWQVPTTTNVSAGLLHVGAEASNISQLSVSLVGIADLSATGTPSSTTFLRGDNTWATPAGAGTVTSVAMTVPSWLTVAGSPVTSSGTLAVTATTGETANEFLATPNGSSGALALRTIVGADFGSLTGCGTSGYVFTPADNDCIAASGTSAFSSLTSGTNTAAAMVVGSGASLAPTGTGTIQATNIASTISAGTNVTITGSGTTGSPYSISASGSGGSGLTGRTISGTTDTLTSTQNNTQTLYTSASSVAVALNSAASVGAGWSAVLWQQGAGTVTVTPASGTINGNATLVFTQGEKCLVSIDSDGTDFDSPCGNGPILAGTNVTLTPSSYGLTVNASGGGSSGYVNLCSLVTLTNATCSGGVISVTSAVASVTIASIPTTYTNLKMSFTGALTTLNTIDIQFNGDSTDGNYKCYRFSSVGNSACSVVAASGTIFIADVSAAVSGTSTSTISINNASGTGMKGVTSTFFDSQEPAVGVGGGTYIGTSPISQIVIASNVGGGTTIAAGTSITLHGTN